MSITEKKKKNYSFSMQQKKMQGIHDENQKVETTNEQIQ